MLIQEITQPKSLPKLQADAANRGLSLEPQAYARGYQLQPSNMDQIQKALKKEGFQWVDYRSLLVKDIGKLKDYPAAAQELEQVLGPIPKIVKLVKDYKASTAYQDLQRMQEYLANSHIHKQLQLFMPRPSVLNTRDRWWWGYNDEGEPLHEQRPVLSPGVSQSPPGHNKPGNAFWTSSLVKGDLTDGVQYYKSEWTEWVCNNQPKWWNPVGYVYRISPSARILRLDDSHDAQQIYNLYRDLGAPIYKHNIPGLPQDLEIDMRMNFPWPEISKHWDGVSHREIDRHSFTYGWDIDSQAWFNTDVLQYVGEVKIQPCD